MIVEINECRIKWYANIAGYAKNSVSRSWLLEINVFAAGNNEVRCGWCFTYYNCRISRFYNQGLTVDDVVYILTFQASPRLWPLLQSTYIMVYKFACACKLCSITQKWVRSNVFRWLTRLYNPWMTMKNQCKLWNSDNWLLKFWVINECFNWPPMEWL